MGEERDEGVPRRPGGPAPQFLQHSRCRETMWHYPIACRARSTWRFTRNNGITEGFQPKMEVLQRQVYGFRNFNKYRLRVKVLCS